MFKDMKKKKAAQTVSVALLVPTCFDGLELFLVYKLQHKDPAPKGNGVYFCSK